MSAITHSLTGHGSGGLVIDIECHLANNLPTIVIIGFASKAVNEARDRLRGAFVSSGLELPRRRITINLAPADVPKTDSSLDLGMAISILVAAQQLPPLPGKQAVIGELGLDGSVRPVRGIIGKLLSGRDQGLNSFFIPAGNLLQAQLVPSLNLLPVANLRELYDHLAGRRYLTTINTGNGLYQAANRPPAAAADAEADINLDDIAGQAVAKRVLTIAAAGGHNALLIGPPGTGKSLLARALLDLLPPLSHEEMLEVTQLHSLASNDYDKLFTDRPLRQPHHSTSHIAMIGGGGQLRPGEISLSHRGVLLLDELPEFSRNTLEALRQPLEDKLINVTRIKDRVAYPANFILVATANPCPCGYYGSRHQQNACRCEAKQINAYNGRLSGPILDRIDLACDVYEVDHAQLLDGDLAAPGQTAVEVVRQQVAAARRRQAARYQTSSKLNADLTNREMKRFTRLTTEAKTTLNSSAQYQQLSARAYLRTIKVAQTIADLANSPQITKAHITEALSYRRRQPPKL